MSDPEPPKAIEKNSKRKSWKEIHKEKKEQRKTFREQNLIKKLDKQHKREEVQETKEEDAPESIPVLSTLSIAIPGSILNNAQSPELRTYLAGQIARAACIFRIDEVVIFDDIGTSNQAMNAKRARLDEDGDSEEAVQHCCLQLARILQYLECPQYLRKFFFPIHKDLRFSGLLNPLDAPHHLRQQNEFIFREGVVTAKAPKQSKGSYVNIGLLNDCLVDKILTPGLRVTVQLDPDYAKSKKIRGKIVSPSRPLAETGVYWGYTVRIAKSLSEVFTKCPYEDGYDLTIGTSDKGEDIRTVEKESLPYNHGIAVFGGLQGLESALESDEKLDITDPSLLFQHYLNVVPNQGSRTIRTEEAILVALTSLEDKLNPVQRPRKTDWAEFLAQSEDTGVKQFTHNNKKQEK